MIAEGTKKQSNKDASVFPSQTREKLRANPSPTQVARELGLNVATVYRHAKGMDLKLLRRSKKLGLSTADTVKLLAVDEEFTRTEIAEKLGCTVAYVSGVLSDD
jgi:DNA-directed RNA polymerase specialized sigma subunit